MLHRRDGSSTSQAWERPDQLAAAAGPGPWPRSTARGPARLPQARCRARRCQAEPDSTARHRRRGSGQEEATQVRQLEPAGPVRLPAHHRASPFPPARPRQPARPERCLPARCLPGRILPARCLPARGQASVSGGTGRPRPRQASRLRYAAPVPRPRPVPRSCFRVSRPSHLAHCRSAPACSLPATRTRTVTALVPCDGATRRTPGTPTRCPRPAAGRPHITIMTVGRKIRHCPVPGRQYPALT